MDRAIMDCGTGRIVNIQRYTIHDGPGVRTEIFFKGCSLHCMWCSNPEAISAHFELGVYPSRCIGLEECGNCIESCPLGQDSPLVFENNCLVFVDRDRCVKECALCSMDCYSNALKSWGDEYEVDDLIEVILKDRVLYQKSQGGVTLSGGEVLLQSDFAASLLKRCKEHEIHTCVETALAVNYADVEKVLPYCDLLITDIKTMSEDVYRLFVGSNLQLVLENIKKVVESGVDVVLRIPVIPGVNDDDWNLAETARFIKQDLGNRIIQLQLLPYKRLGEEKYLSLGRGYPEGMLDGITPDLVDARVEAAESFFRGQGINAVKGANEKMQK